MEKGPMVAWIVAVFAVGLVFGSFSGFDQASGRATTGLNANAVSNSGSTAVISILPDIAKPNDIMRGYVEPGSNGALQGIRLYKVDEIGRLSSIVDECITCFCPENRVCYNRQDYSFILPQLEPGYYAASVADAVTNERVYALFLVD